MKGALNLVKDDNYYTVFYWFIHELGLKGAELPIFAIIYAFSQDEVSYFSGSQSYIAEFAGVTRRTVINVIDNLIKKGLVNKEIKHDEIRYKVNFDTVKKIHKGCEMVSQGVCNDFTGGVKWFHKGCEMVSHNNKPYIDIDNNRDIDTMSTFINYWNENIANSTIKSITKINPNSQRYHNLNARVKEHGVDEIKKAMDNIAKSDFLNGKNNRGWTITFDWFVKPNNFIKVLEGNYTNAAKGSNYCEY